MRTTRRVQVLLIMAVVATVAGIVWWRAVVRREALPGRMAVPELVMTKAWNGEVVHVPGALAVPPWLKRTREYRRVLRRGFALDLTTTDLDGNTYVAHALGREKNDAGEYVVCFSHIDKHRPDGLLENMTLFGRYAEPVQWDIRGEQGHRTVQVSRNNAGKYTVRLEDEKGTMTREWEVDPNLYIYSEQVRGEDGHYHFTHRLH
jgi:hypothetical protein